MRIARFLSHDASFLFFERKPKNGQYVLREVDPENLCGQERKRQSSKHRKKKDGELREVVADEIGEDLLDVLEHDPAFAYRSTYGVEIIIEEHDVGDFFCKIGAG